MSEREDMPWHGAVPEELHGPGYTPSALRRVEMQNRRALRLANVRNGLAYPHDDVCCFQSMHGHHLADGYFRMDAMPYKAVIRLLLGGEIEVIDGTQHNKPLSDALKWGVPAWCRVFNRAIRQSVKVCEWETEAMHRAANHHDKLVHTYRKLAELYGSVSPAIIGQNVHLTCHQNITWDDKPDTLRAKLYLPKLYLPEVQVA